MTWHSSSNDEISFGNDLPKTYREGIHFLTMHHEISFLRKPLDLWFRSSVAVMNPQWTLQKDIVAANVRKSYLFLVHCTYLRTAIILSAQLISLFFIHKTFSEREVPTALSLTLHLMTQLTDEDVSDSIHLFSLYGNDKLYSGFFVQICRNCQTRWQIVTVIIAEVHHK